MSIGGLSSTTGTSTSTIRGYGGLASGLDRDTLIEQLTSGRQAKIDKANQEKTKLEWIQEAIRTITDKMYDFTQKYTSYTSSDNLLGSALYSRSQITVNGANSKYISVSGSTQASELMSVLGVKQLAQQASLSTVDEVSDRLLSLGSLSTDLNTKTDVNVAGGERIYIEYGNTSYTVKLGRGDGYSYGTAQEVADSINKSLEQVTIAGGKTLADVMNFTVSGDKLVANNTDAAGNTITMTGGTGEILTTLGFTGRPDDGFEINAGGNITAGEKNRAIQQKRIADQLGGQTISFSYNGTTKWIELPSASELKDKTLDDLQSTLQKELDSAFGNGRIKVELTKSADGSTGALSFKTTIPQTGADGRVVPGADDTTSTLSIVSSTGNLTGDDSLFQVANGESNRLNLSAKISESGLSNSLDPSKPFELIINGKKIEGIDENSSIQDIINAVNNDSDAGVTISYQENTDRFVVTSNQNGASGQVIVKGSVADALFGSKGKGYTVTEGQDAIISVQYAGSNEVTEIRRDSNTISMDGLNVTVSGTFGYDENGNYIQDTEKVTFTAKVDTDKAYETIKSMVDDYNEILELINEEVSTKPDRDYSPLTSSQKAEMSEDEIKLWEEKAKEGLLFMDSDMRSLADSLRFVIPSNLRSALSEIGISTSTDYSENGKLTIDESKLKAALESDPEKVRELFTASAQTEEDGTVTKGGLMTHMKSIFDQYAGTTGSTKGILIERAGSEHSVTSVMDNALLDQMNEIDDKINRLLDQLTTEQDRYISQFTQLDQLISQMNSQSSWLTSMIG